MSTPRSLIVCLLVVLLLIAEPGCMRSVMRDRAASRAASIVDSLWTREELYFGTDISDGGVVTDSAWKNFLDDEITPRFPSGLTILTGEGQYMYEGKKLAKEKTRIVILFYQENFSNNNKAIEEIISVYKRKFSQESVLRVRSLVRVKF